MNDWSMKPSERMNYDKMFESLRPVNGTVAGDKVNSIKYYIVLYYIILTIHFYYCLF